MAGQIIQKGDRKWLVRVFMGRDSQSGKKQYHSKQISGNKKDAQRYLNGVLRDKDLGIFVEPSLTTLNRYLDEWLSAAVKARVTERTYESYKSVLESYVRPILGGRKLSGIKPLDIQGLYNGLQIKGLSARTVRYTHAVLASALKQAVRWRLLVYSPAAMVELPRQGRKEMRAMSPREAVAFLDAASEDRYGVLFAVALATGMRPEEYLGLQWKDLDLNAGTIRVQRTLVWRRKGGGWYYGEPKTTKSRRNVPISAPLVNRLLNHKRMQAEDRLKAGPKYENNDLVFATREGGPLMTRNVDRRHYKPLLRRAELSTAFRLYDLRHTCATLLLANGENPKVVSERLGHASVTLTLDTYSHVLPSMQHAASAKLENLLFAAG
jgi:integrase